MPSFDSIDYSDPTKYLDLHPSFAGELLASHAARFAAETKEASLAKIWRWLSRDFEVRNETSDYGWRSAAEIIQRRAYIGCADHALVYGCLARSCGIPTVWVKSMHVGWIRKYRRDSIWDGGKGHVYLEIFLNGHWCLLDATQDELFVNYTPGNRLLPGFDEDRYAYDKGGDPRALILSLDWEPWVEQTKRVFSCFDLRHIDTALRATVGTGRRLSV